MSSNTEILRPGIEKFTLPEIPDFKGNAPWLSVLSLLGFLVTSLAAFACSQELTFWSRAPFLFTALGSGIGFAYEFWLIAMICAHRINRVMPHHNGPGFMGGGQHTVGPVQLPTRILKNVGVRTHILPISHHERIGIEHHQA